MRQRMLRASLVIVAVLVASAAAQSRRMELGDLGRIMRLSDPQIAPDGKSIVVVMSRANYDENRYDADLVMIDIASGGQRALTHDRRGVGQPRFSPSGDRLAFLASVAPAPGQPARAQIFMTPLAGGDARRVTNAPKGVQHYAWSPDGRTIAYATEDEAEKKTGPERFNDSFEIENDDVFVQSQRLPTHVWIVPAEGGESKRLTSGSWSLPISYPPGPPASPLTWSPDGRSIAVVRLATPHSGDNDRATIQVVDVATGQMRGLTGRERYEGQPVFSPDGSQIAYWQPRDGDTGSVNEIHVAPSAGGAGRSITRALDRNVARSIWMPDGKTLLVGANDNTKVSLWLQPLDGAARKLDLGPASPSSSFWVDVAVGKDGSLAFTATDPTRPAELYYMSSPTAAPKRLTNVNAEIAALSLGRTEVITWKSDGFTHNGTLTYPPDFSPGQKYPLVLVIHGGPRAASLETFAASPQIMAAKGWVVFQPNYRGSRTRARRDGGPGGGQAARLRGYHEDRGVGLVLWWVHDHMAAWQLHRLARRRGRRRRDRLDGSVQPGGLERPPWRGVRRIALDGSEAPAGVHGAVPDCLRLEDPHADAGDDQHPGLSGAANTVVQAVSRTQG
jgi:dipeptidyl aminopeptidase/acylaminoacyl peptidase